MKKLHILSLMALLSLGSMGNIFAAAPEDVKEIGDAPPSYAEVVEPEIREKIINLVLDGWNPKSRAYIDLARMQLREHTNMDVTTKDGTHVISLIIEQLDNALHKLETLLDGNARIPNKRTLQLMKTVLEKCEQLNTQIQERFKQQQQLPAAPGGPR